VTIASRLRVCAVPSAATTTVRFNRPLPHQELDDNAVPPLAVELAVAAMDADFGKAELLQQRAARSVFREDAARQFMQTAGLSGCD
jgi:hypothetical protein